MAEKNNRINGKKVFASYFQKYEVEKKPVTSYGNKKD